MASQSVSDSTGGSRRSSPGRGRRTGRRARARSRPATRHVDGPGLAHQGSTLVRLVAEVKTPPADALGVAVPASACPSEVSTENDAASGAGDGVHLVAVGLPWVAITDSSALARASRAAEAAARKSTSGWPSCRVVPRTGPRRRSRCRPEGCGGVEQYIPAARPRNRGRQIGGGPSTGSTVDVAAKPPVVTLHRIGCSRLTRPARIDHPGDGSGKTARAAARGGPAGTPAGAHP